MRINFFWLCLVMSILIFASGCTTAPRVETVEVQVPVRVPCTVAEPDEPEWAATRLKPGSSVYEQMRALLADRGLAGAYSTELRTALRVCKS